MKVANLCNVSSGTPRGCVSELATRFSKRSENVRETLLPLLQLHSPREIFPAEGDLLSANVSSRLVSSCPVTRGDARSSYDKTLSSSRTIIRRKETFPGEPP